jgi:signal transduction histidine kinase
MQERLRRFINDRVQLVAAISHDLRTPITRLRLRAELSEDDEKRRRTQQDLAEMEAMIEATLSFAREEATPEPRVSVDLVSLLESVCDDLPAVSVHIGPQVPQRVTLHCQPLAMRRCIGNLVGNAVKYGQRAEVALSVERDAILITIDDEGPGIPLADQQRVFEPFLRLDASRSRATGGVGLGLTIARAAARAHGGEVLLANRSRGGLRVMLRLPAGVVPVQESAAA